MGVHPVEGAAAPAGGCGRRGAARAPAPRGGALPDTQRAVAVTARTGWRMTRVSGPSRPAWRVRSDDQRLLRRHRAGARNARTTLIERYMPLARALALRYRRSPEEIDDLVQVASLGLVKAVDRWDPDRGVAFTTFAVPTILGELRHHLRDSSWCVRPPRRLQDLSQSIDRARRKLRAATRPRAHDRGARQPPRPIARRGHRGGPREPRSLGLLARRASRRRPCRLRGRRRHAEPT